jgi:hypothetical protein
MGGATRAHKRDDLYPILSKFEYGEPACIVWQPSCSMWFLKTTFFLLIVWGLLEKKRFFAKKNWGVWGDNFYMARRMGRKTIFDMRFFFYTLQLKLWPFKVSP